MRNRRKSVVACVAAISIGVGVLGMSSAGAATLDLTCDVPVDQDSAVAAAVIVMERELDEVSAELDRVSKLEAPTDEDVEVAAMLVKRIDKLVEEVAVLKTESLSPALAKTIDAFVAKTAVRKAAAKEVAAEVATKLATRLGDEATRVAVVAEMTALLADQAKAGKSIGVAKTVAELDAADGVLTALETRLTKLTAQAQTAKLATADQAKLDALGVELSATRKALEAKGALLKSEAAVAVVRAEAEAIKAEAAKISTRVAAATSAQDLDALQSAADALKTRVKSMKAAGGSLTLDQATITAIADAGSAVAESQSAIEKKRASLDAAAKETIVVKDKTQNLTTDDALDAEQVKVQVRGAKALVESFTAGESRQLLASDLGALEPGTIVTIKQDLDHFSASMKATGTGCELHVTAPSTPGTDTLIVTIDEGDGPYDVEVKVEVAGVQTVKAPVQAAAAPAALALTGPADYLTELSVLAMAAVAAGGTLNRLSRRLGADM